MRALVLGGCGFVGSHLVEELLCAGHQVAVFDRSVMPLDLAPLRVTHFQSDLSNTTLLRTALLNTDVVYHLASSSVPHTSQRNPLQDIQDNLKDMARLLKAMRATDCRRIIYFSSGGTVYGESTVEKIDETHPLAPISAHGMMKVAVERYLRQGSSRRSIDAIILRVANAYGPRQGKTGVQGFINTCLHHALRSEPINIWGDGSAVRDYVYVKDVAQLARIAGESSLSEGTFNVGTSHGTSLNQVVNLVSEIRGFELKMRHHMARSYDVLRNILSITNAKNQFSWSPTMALEHGIQELFEDLANRVSPAAKAPARKHRSLQAVSTGY